ncbi:hypothetical protein AB0C33_35525 [Nonomuraea sp. NPDC048881]|uniref:hypothetical protein n=1 Tax=Nonomuraea sp. NPDC048881 TaxID=3155030 RepID=UPI0033CB0A77
MTTGFAAAGRRVLVVCAAGGFTTLLDKSLLNGDIRGGKPFFLAGTAIFTVGPPLGGAVNRGLRSGHGLAAGLPPRGAVRLGRAGARGPSPAFGSEPLGLAGP